MTFGSDPEFFVTYNNDLVSAIPVVARDKNNPWKINGHNYYYDNVLAEVAIRPANSGEEAVINFREALRGYRDLITPHKLTIRSYARFPTHQLNHPDAFKVGCKTEWCAYEIAEKIGPIETITKGIERTAGGHIHLGGSRVLQDGLGQLAVVRMLDLFLAMPMIFIDTQYSSTLRRQLYGQAGRHRRPVHGLEYRTLSNYWLSSPVLVELVFDICSWVVKFVENGDHQQFWTLDEDWAKTDNVAKCHHCAYNLNGLRQCIDKNDGQAVNEWWGFAYKYLPANLSWRIREAIPLNRGLYREWCL
jgi:Phage phiEco32-like COOH.NH2 ligase-type 2